MSQDKKELTMPSTDPSKVIVFGFSVIFIVFGLIGGWMSYAPLAASSVAVGKVSADTNKKTVQHLEGGKIDAIYVKDGDVVKKGQILLKLSDVQIKAQLNILNSQYQDSIALFARLQAQRDDLDKINFPEDLMDENAIKDQTNIFETTKRTIKSENEITQNRIVQLENQIDGLTSLIDGKIKRLNSISEEIKEWEELFKKQLVDKQRIRELKREENLINGDVSNTKSEILKLKEQISELKGQQLLREKEFKKETLQRYVEVKSNISDLKAKIIAQNDTLSRTSILSPSNGIVVGMNLHTVGGVVNSSKTILEILPENSKLIVIAQVVTNDIDKVRTGLLSDIRFSAFNLNQAHVVEGKVVHVSADNFIDEATGMPYYEAKIEVTDKGKEQLKEYGFTLVAGMPAEVMIRIGTRTPMSYFVKPFMDMLSRGFNEE
jgi:epimerase transport system membrane fusion protein